MGGPKLNVQICNTKNALQDILRDWFIDTTFYDNFVPKIGVLDK